MEVRGGNGYIEDWINARLVRDAHLGVLWEGTSNINALDIITRAVAKVGAHEDLQAELQDSLDNSADIPGQYRGELSGTVERAFRFAEEVASTGNEPLCRQASDALYNATSATLLAREGAALGATGGDARRLVLSRMVVDHRLSPRDPLAAGRGDQAMIDALLAGSPISLAEASDLVAA